MHEWIKKVGGGGEIEMHKWIKKVGGGGWEIEMHKWIKKRRRSEMHE